MKKRKTINILLAVLLVLACIVIPSAGKSERVCSAASDSIIAEGTYTTSYFEGQGQKYHWELSSNGSLLLDRDSPGSIAMESIENPVPAEYREKVTELKFGETVHGLEENNFFGFDNVRKVSFSAKLTSLGPHSLGSDLPIKEITVPKTVQNIDAYAFAELHALKKIIFNCSKINFHHGIYGNSMPDFSVDTVVFGSTVKSISAAAFKGTQSIHTVLFLGDYDYSSSVFKEAEDLNVFRRVGKSAVLEEHIGEYKKVTIPSSANGLPVSKVGAYAFEGKNRITSVTLPSSIKSVGKYAFYGCSRMKSISLPEGLNAIGSFAFYGCNSLTSITIPTSVSSIGEYAFQNCYALKTVKIGEEQKTVADLFIEPAYAAAVKNATIKAGAFKGCKKLKSLIIGKNVSKIGSKAFYNCKNLRSIKIKTKKLKKSSIGKNAFKGIYKRAVIKVPKKKVKAYKKILKKRGIGKKVVVKKL